MRFIAIFASAVFYCAATAMASQPNFSTKTEHIKIKNDVHHSDRSLAQEDSIRGGKNIDIVQRSVLLGTLAKAGKTAKKVVKELPDVPTPPTPTDPSTTTSTGTSSTDQNSTSSASMTGLGMIFISATAIATFGLF